MATFGYIVPIVAQACNMLMAASVLLSGYSTRSQPRERRRSCGRKRAL
jgi:hypothetical protein